MTLKLATGDHALLAMRWQEADGSEGKHFQILTFDAGRIIHIQDCRSARDVRRRLRHAA